jgi:hypothetical protein
MVAFLGSLDCAKKLSIASYASEQRRGDSALSPAKVSVSGVSHVQRFHTLRADGFCKFPHLLLFLRIHFALVIEAFLASTSDAGEKKIVPLGEAQIPIGADRPDDTLIGATHGVDDLSKQIEFRNAFVWMDWIARDILT